MLTVETEIVISIAELANMMDKNSNDIVGILKTLRKHGDTWLFPDRSGGLSVFFPAATAASLGIARDELGRWFAAPDIPPNIPDGIPWGSTKQLGDAPRIDRRAREPWELAADCEVVRQEVPSQVKSAARAVQTPQEAMPPQPVGLDRLVPAQRPAWNRGRKRALRVSFKKSPLRFCARGNGSPACASRQPALKSSPNSPFALLDRLRAERKAEQAAKVGVAARILAAESVKVERNAPGGDTDV